MSLRIEQLFGQISLQGAPSYGLRNFGVPVGGCFDRESQSLANALIGNEVDAPCLELAMCKIQLRAQSTVTFAWVGAGASNGLQTLRTGEETTFDTPQSGCRSYLAMSGGVKSDLTELRVGSTFQGTTHKSHQEIRLLETPRSMNPSVLRVVTGPQASHFSLQTFVNSTHEVSLNMNRIGIRLNSKSPQPHNIELTSEPAVQGAIQIPPDGHPIILGPDGPTIGGYPKIAVVIQADWNRLGQLRPGEQVRFEIVLAADARQIYKDSIDKIEKQVAILSALSSF